MRHSIVALALLVSSAASAQETDPAPRLAEAARAFLDSLDAEQRVEAAIPFNSEERLDWHYFPRERPGLSMKKMQPEQKQKALALVKEALSEKGYHKTETIRALDTVLHEMSGDPNRDPDLFDIAVFGEPSSDQPWGVRYEGHHLSLTWTVAGGKVIASTPQFLGANPAEVASGDRKGTRALAAEEDLARELVKSLDDTQRAQAVLSAEAPPEILTGAQREAAVQENLGISYSALNQSQQGLLLSLLDEYAGSHAPAIARERTEKLKAAGLDAIKFAWMGGLEKGEGHYYRIQGPTFLVEYDNTQNNANHIHTVWRDFKGDFGLDILKQHYARFADPARPGNHKH